jgi:leucine-zipper of insertion element IS481
MKLHANARLSLKGRELLVDRVERAGWSLTQAAEAAGVSERTAACDIQAAAAITRGGGLRAPYVRSAATSSGRSVPSFASASTPRGLPSRAGDGPTPSQRQSIQDCQPAHHDLPDDP